MNKTTAVVFAALTGLAGCAALLPPPEPPPEAAIAASAEANSAAPAGIGPIWQVRRATCAQLLAAPEPGRRDVAMFYYGYFAARNGIGRITTREIGAALHRVMEQCARTPGLRVADAFQTRLATPPRWFWQTR